VHINILLTTYTNLKKEGTQPSSNLICFRITFTINFLIILFQTFFTDIFIVYDLQKIFMTSFTVMTEIGIIIYPIATDFDPGIVIKDQLYFLISTPVLFCFLAVEISSLIKAGFTEIDVFKTKNQPGSYPDWFIF